MNDDVIWIRRSVCHNVITMEVILKLDIVTLDNKIKMLRK